MTTNEDEFPKSQEEFMVRFVSGLANTIGPYIREIEATSDLRMSNPDHAHIILMLAQKMMRKKNGIT